MATAPAELSDDGRGSPMPESVAVRMARKIPATENFILKFRQKRTRHPPRPSPKVRSGEFQLRRDLEGNPGAIRPAIEGYAVEIAFVVSNQIADREQAVTAAGKDIKGRIVPGAA